MKTALRRQSRKTRSADHTRVGVWSISFGNLSGECTIPDALLRIDFQILADEVKPEASPEVGQILFTWRSGQEVIAMIADRSRSFRESDRYYT